MGGSPSISKPQSEAYLGSVIGRRGTSQKAPYSAGTGTRRRAAQDEYRALGDLGRRSRRTTRGPGMLYRSLNVGNGEPYKLKSIRKERSPAGAEGIDWHRYVITQGSNTIVGHRRGSTSSVRLAVEGIVLHLNDRRVGKLSRAILSSHPFLKKKKRDLSRTTGAPRPQ